LRGTGEAGLRLVGGMEMARCREVLVPVPRLESRPRCCSVLPAIGLEGAERALVGGSAVSSRVGVQSVEWRLLALRAVGSRSDVPCTSKSGL
jgi:hypothetical protein